MAPVQGTCDHRFKEVETLLQGFLDSGDELGASIVVNIDGHDVVDLWGGYADAARTRAWTQDTITNVWSTSKTITALAGLLLIERGILSPSDKVSKHWPEFAANGKQDVEVRHVLSHTSGVSGWDAPMTMADILDTEKSTALLARQAPFWPPGTAFGYHSLTMGSLVGELVRRTTGKSLKRFIADEIAGPLRADFQLGAAEADWARVAEIVPPPAKAAADSLVAKNGMGLVTVKTFANPPVDASIANTPQWRCAEVGAANGHGNARGVARILSAIALDGRVGDVQLLSPKTIDLIFQQQADSVDLAAGLPFRFGIGYGLTGKHTEAKWLPDGRICFWGGWGGSVGIVDVERRMTISYVMNKMENVVFGNDRSKACVQAVYRALGVQTE
ncbi:putative beta-lactamase protein [Neofusicoccum parvum]|uniref:Beta-lactamase protein n=1 Tax=Neofusicoccum parvum TaxID=310453 RepID=A0ACB5SDA0_9PEZI|nr:putative beta-lactamase protein [Neofusicoccum parvum]